MNMQNMMKPILITAEEVNAIISGDKTQHRLIISPQPYLNEHGWTVWESNGVRISDQCVHTSPFEKAFKERIPKTDATPFNIGSRLWVQEPTYTANSWDWFYAATNSLVECKDPFTPNDLHLPWDDEHQEYTGPISAEYLPLWASRLTLEITDIRVERVKEITHNDSVAEQCFNFTGYENLPPLSAFPSYWRTKHGDEAWRSNPWVWVIEFNKETK